jgi:hypothetical protein
MQVCLLTAVFDFRDSWLDEGSRLKVAAAWFALREAARRDICADDDDDVAATEKR